MDFTASMSKSFISKKTWRMHLQRCARNQGAIPDVTWSSWDGVHFLDSSMYGAVLDAGGQNSIGNTWMLQLLLSSACTVLRPPSSAPIARRLGVGKDLEEAMAGTYNMLCKGTGRSLSQVAVVQGLTGYRSACRGWLLLYHLGEKFVFFFFPSLYLNCLDLDSHGLDEDHEFSCFYPSSSVPPFCLGWVGKRLCCLAACWG